MIGERRAGELLGEMAKRERAPESRAAALHPRAMMRAPMSGRLGAAAVIGSGAVA
jgi:hypothetical protein